MSACVRKYMCVYSKCFVMCAFLQAHFMNQLVQRE